MAITVEYHQGSVPHYHHKTSWFTHGLHHGDRPKIPGKSGPPATRVQDHPFSSSETDRRPVEQWHAERWSSPKKSATRTEMLISYAPWCWYIYLQNWVILDKGKCW